MVEHQTHARVRTYPHGISARAIGGTLSLLLIAIADVFTTLTGRGRRSNAA